MAKVTEADVRAMKLRPGTPAPLSGQYTMRIPALYGIRPARNLHCTMVRGHRLPSAGRGTAGHVWRLTDPTKRKRK